MSALAQFVIKEALGVVLPIVAEQIAAFAAKEEPQVKDYLGSRFGHGSPIVEEVFQLLIEPGLVTIGGLLTALGGAAPTAHAVAVPQLAAHAANPIIPVYNQDDGAAT